MKNIKRVSTQLSSDSSIKTTVISISQYDKNAEYCNNESKIDLIAYDGSLYVFGGYGTRIFGVDDPTREGDFLLVVRKGEPGSPGPKGENGTTPEAPEFRARFEQGHIVIYSIQNGAQRRETTSPDLTGPSWRPVVDGNILSWERSWDKSTPNSINLDVLRPTNEHPILLRTNSDNTKRSDETSGPANFIQWKYEGQEEWTNLISISDLMNLALAGVSVWYDEDDEKYHFGHKRINKASYDVGKKGGQIISAVELDDEEILYDAGPLPFATQNEMNTAMLDIDRIDGILCDLAQQIEDTRLAIPDVSDCIREPIKTINGETLLGSGNILIPIVEKTSDIENDSGFITSADIPANVSAFNNDAGYITEAALDGYAKMEDIPEAQDLSGYLTKDEAANTYQPKGDYLTEEDLADYAKKSDIPSLEPYVKKADVATINGQSLINGGDLEIYSLGNVTASAVYGENLGVTVTPTINGSVKDLHFAFTFPSATPIVQDASVVINATPSDASISVNGEVKGTGSYTYEGKVGDSISIAVFKNAYFTETREFTLAAENNPIDISLVAHATTWTFKENGQDTDTITFAYNDSQAQAKTLYVKTNTGIEIIKPDTFDNYFALVDENGNPVSNSYGVIDSTKEWKIYPKQDNTNDVRVEMTLKYRCARYEEEHTSGGEKTLYIYQNPADPTPRPEVGDIQFNVTPADSTLSVGDSASSLSTVSLVNGSYTVTNRPVLSPLYYKVIKNGYITQSGSVIAIDGETKIVNINLEEEVVEKSIDAWSSETTFSANPPENSYLTLQVDPTNVNWKVTHIPSFTSAKIQTEPGVFVDVTADDTVYDSTKVFRLYANNNTLTTNLVDDFIVISTEDSSITDHVTFTQLAAESTEITLTIVPTPSAATVRVSKLVDGSSQRVTGLNNVFTLNAGDQVTATVSAVGYQTLTRTETLNTSATWNMALAYLPLTIYFDNADAANVSDASVLERTFNIDAGGTSQGETVDPDDPGHTNVPGESDIDDGDGTTGTISGTIVSNTSGIGEGAIEAKWGQDWDKSSAPDYQLTFNVTDENGNAVNWTSVKLMAAYCDDNDQIGKLGRKWILQHTTEYNTSSDARVAYINMNLLSSGGSNVLSQSHVIRMVQSGKTN